MAGHDRTGRRPLDRGSAPRDGTDRTSSTVAWTHNPRRERAAAAVDVISESPQVSTGTYPVSADAIRIEPDRIASRRAATVTCEQVSAEMTPVRDGTLLWELLQGARPDHLFDTASAFEASVEAAQDRTAEWQMDVDEVRVRPVRWQGIEVTLVGT
ncbi:hypothetical protein ACFQH2_14450 [Natronoarchaeum sp. GCM10025703]|uniref:DUF7283 family protein n=1 Tax=Natronoarchaeum sp. GCM10025703 TaxID=3252685 RepID=UPI003606E2B3